MEYREVFYGQILGYKPSLNSEYMPKIAIRDKLLRIKKFLLTTI